MKKLISILLLLAMMLAVLVACNDDKGGEETTPANDDNGVAGGETNEETESSILPPKDLGGYVFRSLGHPDWEGIVYEEDDEIDDTSILVKSKLERDAEVKDMLNVQLVDVPQQSIISYVLTDAMLPYSTYDMGRPWGTDSLAPLITQDIILDVGTIPHLRTEKPWYQQQALEEYSIMGKLYFVSAFYPEQPGSSPLWFNKDMMLELNLELPYDTILAGDWTIEKMSEYCAAAYKDLGSSGRDENDYFGYAGHSRSICYFYQGMDGRTTGRDENGAVTPVISDEKVDAIYSKLIDFYNQSWAWHNTDLNAGVHSSSHRMFYDGNALFIYWVTATLHAEEIDAFERGLAILPKYDLDQETYRCPSGGAYFFPSNIEDVDALGYIFEYLCEASYRIVYPAVIQEAIDFEQLTDEGSIKVQKLVDQSLFCDILKSCDPSEGLLASCGYVWYCISNNTTPSAAASSVKSVVERQFQEFFYGKQE